MNDLLRHCLHVNDVITTADATACGYDRHAITAFVQAGVLHRVHRGAFTTTQAWTAATAEQRHLLRCRAIVPNYRDAVLSHSSAVVAHGLPIYDIDLRTIHLSRTADGRRGRQGAVVVHAALPTDALTSIHGAAQLPACTPAVAVLQVAAVDGLAAGMVAAEGALQRGDFASEDLHDARALARLGRGRTTADLVTKLAGSHSESPGETLARLLFRALRLPEPEQQASIQLPSGAVARVDFLFAAARVVVEFDGAVKYGGASGRAELIREKRREDGLRAAGYRVVRLVWSDLQRPEYVLAQIGLVT